MVLENSFNFPGPQFLQNKRTKLDGFYRRCYGLWFHELQEKFLSTSGIGKHGNFQKQQQHKISRDAWLPIEYEHQGIFYTTCWRENQNEKKKIFIQWVQELSVSPNRVWDGKASPSSSPWG